MKIRSDILLRLIKSASKEKHRGALQDVCVEETKEGVIACASDGMVMSVWMENRKCLKSPMIQRVLVQTNIVNQLAKCGITTLSRVDQLHQKISQGEYNADITLAEDRAYPSGWREVLSDLRNVLAMPEWRDYTILSKIGHYSPKRMQAAMIAMEMVKNSLISIFPTTAGSGHTGIGMIAASIDQGCDELAYSILYPESRTTIPALDAKHQSV